MKLTRENLREYFTDELARNWKIPMGVKFKSWVVSYKDNDLHERDYDEQWVFEEDLDSFLDRIIEEKLIELRILPPPVLVYKREGSDD